MSDPAPAVSKEPRNGPDNEPRSGLGPKQIVAILIGILAVVFVFQNTAKGKVNFLFWSASMPAWVWLLIVFVAGLVVGITLPTLRARGKRKRAAAKAGRAAD